MLSRRFTSVVRPAQYRSTRSSEPIAEQKARMSPEPAGIPALRSSLAKETSMLTIGARAASGTGRDLFQVVPHELEVVALLDHGAEGVVGRLRGEIGLAEEVER